MSVFTNPASAASDRASAYVGAVLDLVKDEEPLAVLRRTASALQQALTGLSISRLAQPEAPSKWSVGEVIAHLADSELVWSYRLRMVLAHDRPRLEGYDQDLWADRLRYRDQDPHEGLDRFNVLRRENLRLLEQASEPDLQRVGVHQERGESRLVDMIRLHAGHDRVHLRQIERILAAHL